MRVHGGRARADRMQYQRSGPVVHFGDLAEQYMQCEPHRQVQDDANHRRRDRRERAGELAVGAQRLDEWCAGEDPEHRRVRR